MDHEGIRSLCQFLFARSMSWGSRPERARKLSAAERAASGRPCCSPPGLRVARWSGGFASRFARLHPAFPAVDTVHEAGQCGCLISGAAACAAEDRARRARAYPVGAAWGQVAIWTSVSSRKPNNRSAARRARSRSPPAMATRSAGSSRRLRATLSNGWPASINASASE